MSRVRGSRAPAAARLRDHVPVEVAHDVERHAEHGLVLADGDDLGEPRRTRRRGARAAGRASRTMSCADGGSGGRGGRRSTKPLAAALEQEGEVRAAAVADPRRGRPARSRARARRGTPRRAPRRSAGTATGRPSRDRTRARPGRAPSSPVIRPRWLVEPVRGQTKCYAKCNEPPGRGTTTRFAGNSPPQTRPRRDATRGQTKFGASATKDPQVTNSSTGSLAAGDRDDACQGDRDARLLLAGEALVRAGRGRGGP